MNEDAVMECIEATGTLHMDHYGGRLPFVCAGAGPGYLELVRIEAGRVGRRFRVVDAGSTYGTTSLGVAHPALLSSITDVLEFGAATDELVVPERSRMLIDLLGKEGYWASQFPFGEYHASGRNSGSEGVELALAIVGAYLENRGSSERSRRDTVLVFEGAWHGWTSGAAALARPSRGGAFGRMTIPFGNEEVLERAFSEAGNRLAAVFVEPIQGDAGIIVPPSGYLRSLAAYCAKYGALLVADETLTYARTGDFFGMRDEQGPVPSDITIVGKALGAGIIPTSIVIARRHLGPRAGAAVATFDLRAFDCRVIRTVARTIAESRLHEHVSNLGTILSRGLTEIVARRPSIFRETRGVGFLHGLELQPKVAEVAECFRTHLIEEGVYLEIMLGAGERSCGARAIGRTLRVAPPLVTTIEQIETIFDRIEAGARSFRVPLHASKRSRK
ncbi:MAG: aminotransferase class III-fold pyridoxal phosphate-dependent enzyme [Magnetospirillum sp. WYHS-4]